MAVINHSGAIVMNEVWQACDEHHITGNLFFQGGAPGNPIVVDVEPSTIINVDGPYWLFYTVGANYGRLNCLGTEANKIVFRPDPTIFPTPSVGGDYHGIVTGDNTIIDLNWVDIQHAEFFAIPTTPNATNVNSRFMVNNCRGYHCNNIIRGSDSNDVIADNVLQIDGLLVIGLQNSFFNGSGYATDFRGTTTIKNVAINWVYNYLMEEGFIRPHPNSKVNIEIDGMLIGICKPWLVRAGDMTVGEYLNVSLKNFFCWGMGPRVSAAFGGGMCGVWLPNNACRGTITVEDSTFYGLASSGIGSLNQQATDTLLFRRIDSTYGGSEGIKWYAVNPSVTIDNIYCYGNRSRDLAPAIPHQPKDPNNQWWNYDNVQTPTNVLASPNFPVDVENVAESGLGANEVTITFDAKLGSNNLRLRGVEFVKYGTTSGGPYPHEAGARPKSKDELFEVFAKWRTDLGSFKTTGHSVTLTNLKPNTTYYYKPCFIDPYFRVAEGVERIFTTTAA
ncbi:MAG: fibronectin type III domain-containing protein [Candidatus Hodarchaeota archaeon]